MKGFSSIIALMAIFLVTFVILISAQTTESNSFNSEFLKTKVFLSNYEIALTHALNYVEPTGLDGNTLAYTNEIFNTMDGNITENTICNQLEIDDIYSGETNSGGGKDWNLVSFTIVCNKKIGSENDEDYFELDFNKNVKLIYYTTK